MLFADKTLDKILGKGGYCDVRLYPVLLLPILKDAIDFNSKTILFSDSGARPLFDSFKLINKKMGKENTLTGTNIFSSKITALSKVQLSKQIISLLTFAEQKYIFNDVEVAQMRKIILKMPNEIKSILLPLFTKNFMPKLSRTDLIELISDIGLTIPSEDSNIQKEIKWLNGRSLHSTDFSKTELTKLRAIMISKILAGLPEIKHETRALLNFALANTTFSSALKSGKIYLIDDAISRGRTLNTTEILLKAFYDKADWKAGFLYGPDVKMLKGHLGTVVTKKRVPTCANRPDIIGLFIVEDSRKFTCINPFANDSACKKDNITTKKNNQEILSFVTTKFDIERKYLLKYKNNIIRFMTYLACEKDLEKVRKCLDLNPVVTKYWVEEMDFYLNQPNPLDNIEQRAELKKMLTKIFDEFTTKCKDRMFLISLKKVKSSMKIYQTTRRFNCINLWHKQYMAYQTTLERAINLLLKNKQRISIVENYLTKSKSAYGPDFEHILSWIK